VLEDVVDEVDIVDAEVVVVESKEGQGVVVVVVVLTVVGVIEMELVVVSGSSPSTVIDPFTVTTGKGLAPISVIEGSVMLRFALPPGALGRISKVKFNTVPFSIMFWLAPITSMLTLLVSGVDDNDLPASAALGPRVTSLKDSLDMSKLSLRLKLLTASPGSALKSTEMRMFLSPGDPDAEPTVRVAASRVELRISMKVTAIIQFTKFFFNCFILTSV
jgi:hypothetical protein